MWTERTSTWLQLHFYYRPYISSTLEFVSGPVECSPHSVAVGLLFIVCRISVMVLQITLNLKFTTKHLFNFIFFIRTKSHVRYILFYLIKLIILNEVWKSRNCSLFCPNHPSWVVLPQNWMWTYVCAKWSKSLLLVQIANFVLCYVVHNEQNTKVNSLLAVCSVAFLTLYFCL